ncbi:MAG: gliding motility-associated C-terminal domain-containing protein [Paludibacter sp.]|nr:gliding motility-associated C-terminal domain-containing protein [Paludibacter sp.]
MKPVLLFFAIFVSLILCAQVNETFSDGDFAENPEWIGITQHFRVNSSGQLQSYAPTTSVSYLFTHSEAIVNAVWECWVKITYPTSSSNFASIYIVSDNSDIVNGCNGYYVQIGGTNDEVSLFVQQGTKKTKIIDGTDKRTDGNPVVIQVKVKRDAKGNFELYSKTATETEYFLEGKTQNTIVKNSSYFGLLYSNTSTTGSAYYFDDILVTGENAPDTEAPAFKSIRIEAPDKVHVTFTEKMNFSKAIFEIDKGVGTPTGVQVATDNKSVKLSFGKVFNKGELYTLLGTGLTDLAGNNLQNNTISTGIPEAIEVGDLTWNEVMFEHPENSVEYLEIYNKSEKVLSISGLVFTSRKTDGTMNTGNKIPEQTLIGPKSYLAWCSDADSLRKYYGLPAEHKILKTSWSTLNNESATIVLCNGAKDTIYDELKYNAKWHHALVKNRKGVALEKINPYLDTQNSVSWHSAGSEVIYGTPGFKNSQYRDIETSEIVQKFVWIEPKAFSPDMDGIDDVCFIRYKTETNGYVANVIILNAVGERVYQLAANVLLSSEGHLMWDGRTDKGKNANVGIYVLYFEAFNPQTGDRKAKKLPIVVTSR